MMIETKFTEGDTIWFIHNAKAIETTVKGVKIERRQLEKSNAVDQTITYLCSRNTEHIVLVKVNEKDSFPTKEDLLQSL